MAGSDMTTGHFIQQRKRRAWQRTISLVLLTLCFFDLAIADVLMPGACERESEILSVLVALSPSSALDQNAAALMPTGQHHQAPSEEEALEEDCICCCAHLVPVAVYKYAQPSLPTTRLVSDPPLIPSAPSVGLFRPPRLS